MDKIAILIQGSSTNVQEQKKVWSNYLDDCLFSTWKGEESKYLNTDNVIFSDIPNDPGPSNINLQAQSTLMGLMHLQKKGYNRVLKIRSDMVPTNPEKFIQILDNEKLNFLCWHNHQVYPNCSGYLVDYLMSGPINAMIDMWSINDFFCVVPEIMLTWKYIQKCIITKIEFFLDKLSVDNDVYWIKNNINLLDYKNNKTQNEYDKYSFTSNHDNLNINYINFLK